MSCLCDGVRKGGCMMDKGRRGGGLDLRAAEELGAGEDGAVVACVGKVDAGGVLDHVEKGKRDDVHGGVWGCVSTEGRGGGEV